MEAIVCDKRFRISSYDELEETEYRKGVKAALEFYEKFPIAKYALIWDEPMVQDQWDSVYSATKIVEEEGKTIKPLTTLLPTSGKVKKVFLKEWEEYYQKANPDRLIYD